VGRISPPWRRVTPEQAAEALRTLEGIAAGVPTPTGRAMRAVRTLAKFRREQDYIAAEKKRRRKRPKN
jgi:hypothetical protein